MIRSVMLGAVCLLLGCGADDGGGDYESTRVEPVVRGARDRGRHPAVVAIRTREGMLCTGALIAPTVVLTARHCVSVTAEAVDCAARRNVFGDHSPSWFEVTASEDALNAPADARVSRVLVPDGTNLCGADVAVLVLDRPLRGITPLAVETRAPRAGDAVTVVGYGRRGDSGRAGVGTRYTRSDVRVTAVSAREVATTEGTCQGDSGSPLIDGRTGRVIAVLSRGEDRCVGGSSVWTRATEAMALIERATRD